jgi:hypothetical protein
VAAMCSTVVNAQSLKDKEKFASEEKHLAEQPEAFLDAIGGPRFLVGQFFTILGTIFGVYLASYVAFQRNLKYDRFVKAQQRSDLLIALREELKQNVDRVRKFGNERLPEAETIRSVLDTEWPRLRLFVWEGAGRSSSALDMPLIMMHVQSLYGDVNDMLNNTEARKMFRETNSMYRVDRNQFIERLNNRLKFVEASIFPAMDEAMRASAQLLKRYSDQKDSKA